MIRDYGDYIQDILNSALEVEEFVRGYSIERFIGDRKTINAVVRSIEVIGEAAKNVSEQIKAKYPQIDWKAMAGMRDKLIHEYFGVDPEILWKVIKEDIPPMLPLLKQMLGELPKI
ncbi:MAG: DUF86 domain-containing protein [Candidatus Margulisbacteria bacterium]|nr:DUF86 domain-containing protein [Candidatus Margulisiibacteriota bacterium]